MTWNWEQPEWPHFTWNQSRLTLAEKEFLVGSGTFVGAIKHLDDENRNQLTVEAMSTAAGDHLGNRGRNPQSAGVQSSIQRQLGLPADDRKVGPAEHGISEMMINLYKTFAVPLTQDTLFEWHRIAYEWQNGLERHRAVPYQPRTHASHLRTGGVSPKNSF